MDVDDDVKNALQSLYFRVFGSNPVHTREKAHEDFDEDLIQRVAELDVTLPALKKEVLTLHTQGHEALVDYWAEKLRQRSEAILSKFGPDTKASTAAALPEGEDYITSLSENLTALTTALAEAGKTMPAVHQKSQTIRRAVVERGEKRKAPSVTEQVIEEERLRKRPKNEEPGVGGS